MVTIDLSKDAADVRRLLTEAVEKYAAKHKAARTAKKHPPVTRIDLIYSLGDSVAEPWVHLHFDTKPGSNPDGDPTHPDFARLPRPDWLPAVQAVCEDEKVTVIPAEAQTKGVAKGKAKGAGRPRECGDDELNEAIGAFLVAQMREANAAGLFADLPRAEHCEFGVEDPTSGSFGWPKYDDRGKENLVK